ncbi:succinate dehydrogenase cytochrome b556 subunit [Thorsellia anophelis]|uniref:Succinate dehydrogenase cytochrome b556 subunit n=1 Tax=Thorsellia anophelis DSM 18579 TaxID=1123402 RepID=A0A1I0EL45_9GAMM|nr:succinate dehydrogenase cytochrome b556 subunit [Thorsellia anophelis]SET45940.1 succinate dehydrogenase subunit C [Thorsellia anophelis DSM 18579]
MVGNILKHKRPVNLDLKTIHFPITAIASILHRVSGVMIFVGLAILIWLLGLSLSSVAGFASAMAIADNFFMKIILWGILTAFAYHVVGGFRHIFMDFGLIKENFESGQKTAKISFIVTAALSVLALILVW